MAEYPHQHLKIPPNKKKLRFAGDGRGSFKFRVDISREEHAARLQKQLSDVKDIYKARKDEILETDKKDSFSLILDIESSPDYPLRIDSLEKKPSKNNDGIYLLNVRHQDTAEGLVTKAAILVPIGQLDSLSKKIADYANPEKDGKDQTPRNAKLLSNIRKIGVAALDALWTDQAPLPDSNEKLWWELWVSRAPRAAIHDQSWVSIFDEEASRNELKVNQFRLRLPDNEIVLLKASRDQFEGNISLLNTLTEVKLARPCSLQLTDLDLPEKFEWIDEAIERIRWPDSNAPAVCLLDTGVNRSHPLLARLITDDDLDTVVPEFGVADHNSPTEAHGTPMAGLAAFDDLRQLMLSTQDWIQEHRIESVKLIHYGSEHEPQNYGAVTQQAFYKPEINHPERKRVYSLAITNVSSSGQPSSWSSAIDASASGFLEDETKKIVFISAGNHRDQLNYRYPSSNYQSKLENPSQAWNAITVGAITHKSDIAENDAESINSRPLAKTGELSPYSTTSLTWDKHWPIKPDIVMEGGNLALNKGNYLVDKPSLEPISTAANFMTNPLQCFVATSASTASASRLGAMLLAKFPNYEAETYRGLVVHSAKWNPRMLSGLNPHLGGDKAAIQNVLRKYGYGEPDRSRLFGSGESGVTMIIEDVLQPYDPESKPGEAKLGFFNLHELPWPQEALANNREIELTLKVTLSYFIYPNPSSRTFVYSKKYRYASHLIRFRFKRSTESDQAFQRALEKEYSDEVDLDEQGAPSDKKWAIGPKLRGKSGSLVQDIWKGSPSELQEMDKVAIYPSKGWFATRSFPEEHEFHKCHQIQVPYSLIISIDAEQEIGLYSEVSNRISLPLELNV